VVRLRSEPEDFRVDEIPLYPPAGEGDHTFLCVEKRLRTTEDVARALARFAGVKPRDVGYAGRKDRVAVATQWFSVPGLDPARARDMSLPGVKLLDAARHPHKLRTGQLRGNRFRIVVRDADERLCAAAAERLERLRRFGMPNRFGAQRFGRDGGNVQRAQRLLRGEAPAADHRSARFLISALQAAVFNAVLAARDTPLDALQWGDVAMIHVSGGCFVVEDPAREAPRAAAFESRAARRPSASARCWRDSVFPLRTFACPGASNCGAPGGRCGCVPRTRWPCPSTEDSCSASRCRPEATPRCWWRNSFLPKALVSGDTDDIGGPAGVCWAAQGGSHS
jgi:hypothetical protein